MAGQKLYVSHLHPRDSPNIDLLVCLSGLEEGEWLENQAQCFILYPECSLAKFPPASLLDNQSPILVPQGPGYSQKIARPGKKQNKTPHFHHSSPWRRGIKINLCFLHLEHRAPKQETLLKFVSPQAETRLDAAAADSHRRKG